MIAARHSIDRALGALWLTAIALWLGGYTALGAVVAPIVFGEVPAPYSADAMTTIFRRFDSISLGCAVVALLVEVAHAALRAHAITRIDLARAGLVAGAAAVAVYAAVAVSPAIEQLHRSGAVRGSGPAGLALDAIHHTAEVLAKIELTLLLGALALSAFRAWSPLPAPPGIAADARDESG